MASRCYIFVFSRLLRSSSFSGFFSESRTRVLTRWAFTWNCWATSLCNLNGSLVAVTIYSISSAVRSLRCRFLSLLAVPLSLLRCCFRSASLLPSALWVGFDLFWPSRGFSRTNSFDGAGSFSEYLFAFESILALINTAREAHPFRSSCVS